LTCRSASNPVRGPASQKFVRYDILFNASVVVRNQYDLPSNFDVKKKSKSTVT
jgi:hypothetical protein